jgi:hypothetical protein
MSLGCVGEKRGLCKKNVRNKRNVMSGRSMGRTACIIMILVLMGAHGDDDAVRKSMNGVWQTQWSVRRDHAVDVMVLLKIVMTAMAVMYKDWLIDSMGKARGEWKYNKTYYRIFGRCVRMLGIVQEVIFNFVDQEGVHQDSRSCFAEECL